VIGFIDEHPIKPVSIAAKKQTLWIEAIFIFPSIHYRQAPDLSDTLLYGIFLITASMCGGSKTSVWVFGRASVKTPLARHQKKGAWIPRAQGVFPCTFHQTRNIR
jgi:hypothetical protein